METAQTVIKDALQEILVQASEQAIDADEFYTAMRYMNRMMGEFAADGITLGYTEVSNPSDAITIPAGAINGLIYNLALVLSTQYDIAVTPELAAKAIDGKRVMTRIATQISPASYPDALPIGSGNEGEYTDTNKFYTSNDPTVDTENGGVIGLEQLP